MKKRRKILLSSFFCLFGILIIVAVPLCGTETKKNVLLITIDTLRGDRLGCYGSENVQTPNIDAFAAKSAIFTRAFAHTSTTLPSHTNILLGMTPLYHGVHDNSNFLVRDEHWTLAEHLKRKGYSTAAFVGAFPLDSSFGLSQGFDTYDDDFGDETSKPIISRERPAEVVIGRALEWMHKTASPWFLWIHCFDPHDPYEPPEPFRTEYEAFPYDGEVAYVDSALKRLFRYAEDRGLFENSVIVFTGDHGEGLGDHEELTHSYFAYNSTIWIPLLIHVPGMKPQVVRQNVSHMDIFPTICDALDIEKPPLLQGVSLIPALKGKKLESRALYFESLTPYYVMEWAPIRGFIQEGNKFIDSPIPELYDLEKDFDEAKNILPDNALAAYRNKLNQIIQEQSSKEKSKAVKALDKNTLEKLRSLGYIGSYPGAKKESFGKEDDVKVLLPYHNRALKALELSNEGKVGVAMEVLREVITAKKNIATAYLNLAMIYRDQGELSGALQVLRMGQEFLPNNYLILSSYVSDLGEAGQWDEIISVFESRSYRQYEYDPVIWNQVGVAYAKIGDFENAVQFCQRAIAIDDTFPISYSNLGMIHFSIFNLTTNPAELPAARLSYMKALELDPKISAAHDGLGLIYLYEENYDKAIHHLELAFQLQPDFNHILYNLGVAHLKKGDKTKALSYFNKFKSSSSYPNFPENEKRKLEFYIKQCKDEI